MATEVNIPYANNILVASNEMFLRATINRNLEKLLENDIYLRNKISAYGTDSEFAIQMYKNTKTYNKGDAVIYIEYNSAKTKILNIYLLECTKDKNTQKPSYTIVEGFVKDFSASGWKDPNPFFAIYNSFDDGINLSSFLEYSISNKFHLSHETDTSWHKFGALKTESDLSSKILLKNLSNIADSRSKMFWAYEIGKVSSSNLSGTYKKWGNGVLEYDLTFSLNGGLKAEKTIADNGSIQTINYLNANTLIPLSSSSFNNDDYFLNETDYYIFAQSGTETKYVLNGVAQTNTTNIINTYHGTIAFPIPFKDDKYMIFTSGTSMASGKTQSVNTITFTNRQKNSITAVYVIPNYNGITDRREICLRNNVFQCQIIGRWK